MTHGARPVGGDPADPFATAALRAANLATWRADPSRLRQDANLEEDHARGYYRDRVAVELAQNAADAAAAARQPGRLLLRLTPTGELLAANTGAPLDAAGVAALASLRASGKRTGTVGRFGVGFAAVRAVSDEVLVTSTSGGVAFSVARAADLLAEAGADQPALAAEVRRRGGELPALRLPFAAPGGAPEGYVTAVRLRLRGPREVDAVRAALAEVGDATLLALPTLAEIVVETDDGERRVVTDVESRWITARAAGDLDPALLRTRPVEERERTGWSVTWALPRSGGHPGVIHAPTPTDDPSTLPALLIASLPLNPSRRRVAPGPLTDAVIAHAATVYANLATLLAAAPGGRGPDPLSLVPVGLPAGPLDAALHDAALTALRRAPLLPEVGTGELVPARAAQALTGPAGQDRAALAALGPFVGGLVALPPGRESQARALGVALRDLPDLVETLPATGPPSRWRELYAALADHGDAETFAGLPVPLLDGRTARGVRGALLPAPDLPEQALTGLARLGLRIVHPQAAHPALARWGATAGGARQLLDHPLLRDAALTEADLPAGPVLHAPHSGVADVLALVLTLVAAALAEGPQPLPDWLEELPLPTAEGEVAAARDLTLPGSWAAEVLDLDRVAPALVARWGPQVLRAAGVRAELVTAVVPDVVADPAGTEEVVDGWEDYLDHLADLLGAETYLGELTVLTDLDAVLPRAWPEVLARVAADPAARAALLTPVGAAPSYAAWWLRAELGAPFAHPRRPTALPFLPSCPVGLAALDDAVLIAVGAVADGADPHPADWAAYLASWPATGELPLAQALALWRALARAAAAGLELERPRAVPATTPAGAALLPAEQVVVATPMWAQVRPVLPAPAGLVEAVADLLDLDTAPDRTPHAPGAAARAVPAVVRELLPGAPEHWHACETLTVDAAEVTWWVDDGQVYATTTAGLARGLAAAAGRWPARYTVEALLKPGSPTAALVEAAGEDTG